MRAEIGVRSEMRAELESKGYELKSAMSKEQFENHYDSLRAAKASGEIKSQPWAELKKRERIKLEIKVKTTLGKPSRSYASPTNNSASKNKTKKEVYINKRFFS